MLAAIWATQKARAIEIAAATPRISGREFHA
jgi:hypothetical protein